MSRGLEPRSTPSAALMMRTSLLPGERLEGAPPGLTLSPAPGTLRSEDIRQQEKNLFHPRINAVIQSASRLWPSPPQMLVTPEGISFLKVKVLLSRFWKWFRSPRILQLICFSDGKVRCDSDCMSCTWSLREYLWCKEPRDQLGSGPDHAGWPVNSPVYTRF